MNQVRSEGEERETVKTEASKLMERKTSKQNKNFLRLTLGLKIQSHSDHKG